jgi:glutaredoxin
MIHQSASLNKQQCNVSGLILSWAGYLAVLVYFAAEQNWIGGSVWLIVIPVVRWILFHYFPSVSRFLGYGRVDDTQPNKLPAAASPSRVIVTFYSFFSCPFCPIVLHRLESLQERMNFTLEKVDVSLKPQILMSKGIRSVPVVEVGTDRLVGNATTEQLAGFIALAHGAA